jgi:hypothetical protein
MFSNLGKKMEKEARNGEMRRGIMKQRSNCANPSSP